MPRDLFALSVDANDPDVGQSPEEDHVVLADPEGNEFCVIGPGNAFLADCGFVGALACDGSQAVGHFWSAALGWPLVWDQEQETAVPRRAEGHLGGPPFRPATARDRLHFDLVPTGGSDQQGEVARLVSLGASRTGTGEDQAVLADPDGNRFRVLPG